MTIEQAEKAAVTFLKEKREAGSVYIASVKQVNENSWEVKGDYAIEGSSRNEAKFTITINIITNEVTAYKFEPIGPGVVLL